VQQVSKSVPRGRDGTSFGSEASSASSEALGPSEAGESKGRQRKGSKVVVACGHLTFALNSIECLRQPCQFVLAGDPSPVHKCASHFRPHQQLPLPGLQTYFAVWFPLADEFLSELADWFPVVRVCPGNAMPDFNQLP